MNGEQGQYRVDSTLCGPDADAQFIEQVARFKARNMPIERKASADMVQRVVRASACGNTYTDDCVVFQFRTPFSGERRGDLPNDSTEVVDSIGFPWRRPAYVRCASHVRRLHLQQIGIRPGSNCFRSVHGGFPMADRRIRCAVGERRVPVREPRSVPIIPWL
ncbi:hypothetical protein Bamb_6496 [Burkholderia ambifaria AMMD]|uniref:Uncharacterized protein n=1 Tax=Burkholderia ambifaria (strain ATCC BAA-244 / DSM 16087 / CCUG 44356 / LMG 19182 / AMMD) TaxID=339670 RepID=Q0B1D3_BURCM|nr:hypothetical protein Bamb_6496 [Burkholderia ambifaria AMMD]